MDDTALAMDEAITSDAPTSDRRRFLRRGAITAAVAAAGGAALTEPAAAGNGDGQVFNIGVINTNTTASTQLTGNVDGGPMLNVQNSQITGSGVPGGIQGNVTGIGAVAVRGNASNTGGNTGGVGVYGYSDQNNGVGVVAQAFNGAALRLHDAGQTIPPSTGNWTKGSLVVSNAQLWYCYVDGTAGASQWMRLSSPLVTLALPFRVYDSRPSQPNPSGSPQGVLTVGAPGRTINCLPAGIAGASAILFNVTLANTVGAVGSVLVWINGGSEPNAASVTWTGSGTVIANAVTSGCDSVQRVQVKCTTGAQTDIILDVVGYYL